MRLMELQRWPGNVRQLKNVVEQVALFNAGETVTRDILAEYLHPGGSSLPAQRQQNDDDRQKMLLRLVMALRDETDRLKERIDALEAERGSVRYTSVADEPVADEKRVTSLIKYPEKMLFDMSASNPLEESEKMTIQAALAKNDGNKRKTADDLNISLRTLYRKLHDLNIE